MTYHPIFFNKDNRLSFKTFLYYDKDSNSPDLYHN